jgi:hypothetical protein
MNVAFDLEPWTETAEATPEGTTIIPKKRTIAVIATRLALASWRRGVDLDVIVHEPAALSQGRERGRGVWIGSMKAGPGPPQKDDVVLWCGWSWGGASCRSGSDPVISHRGRGGRGQGQSFSCKRSRGMPLATCPTVKHQCLDPLVMDRASPLFFTSFPCVSLLPFDRSSSMRGEILASRSL